jgi:hypothetical protein
MHAPDDYCRELEAYLCRKNDGHLIRIVGPAFERVSGWAAMGVPIKIACAGIDRYFERYYRRGPRRRPVRIEFCEADILDAFDDWRRAVGVSIVRESDAGLNPAAAGDGAAAAADAGMEEPAHGPRRVSLVLHVERSVARLAALRGSSQRASSLADVLDSAIRELDGMLGPARVARGAAREALVTALGVLDRHLIDAAMQAADEVTRAAADDEALAALAPFRERMAPEAYRQARANAVERYVREYFGLPVVAFS